MRAKALIALMFVSTEIVAAQQVTTLRADGQCSECRIEIMKSVALGDETGDGTIDHSESVAVRDSQGRFIVNGNYSTFLKLFDRSGHFVRTIGREGGGPGEFRGVGAVDVLPGDTLVVFDWGTSRYSLFSKQHEFLAAGSAGLLWVLIGVPDPEWRGAVTPAKPGEHAQVLDDHGYRDTVLEVIDPARGTVLATARMKERVSHFVSAGIVGTVLEGIDGIPRLQTWTVRLVTTPRAGSR